MALTLRNTRELIKPENFKAKILVYSMPGLGKTTFLGTAPHPLIGACETGEGNGLLTIASSGLPYTEINNYNDFDVFTSGVFAKKCEKEGMKVETLGLDSGSDMSRTFIKDHALTFPRLRGESDKRSAGVPELDDYGIIAELTRKHFRKLIEQPYHVIVTATMKFDKADPVNGQLEDIVGPDFPGQMMLGSTAMFDIVLCLRHMKTAAGTTRYFLTENEGPYRAKSRVTLGVKQVPVLDKEEIFNLTTGAGTFPKLLEKIQTKYAEEYKKLVA